MLGTAKERRVSGQGQTRTQTRLDSQMMGTGKNQAAGGGGGGGGASENSVVKKGVI